MSSTIAGILLLITYVAFIVYAMKGKNLMVGFFVLAIIWAAISGASFKDILGTVIQGGIVGNAGLIFTIMFGAWFGRVLVDTGITSSIIRKAVELGGDKPLVVGILLSIVTAAIFTSSFGSGVVIAVGIIILPILMALGMPKVLAIVSFIMSIASGTIINAVYYNQLVTMIPGVEYNQIVPFCLAAIGVNELIIGVILEQEGLNGFAVPTVESGIYGGVALGGADFGVGKNCTAIIPHEQQFDFYDGRGVDVCFMGVGEIDRFGNVNSTKMGKQVAGAGGFIDITSNAGCVVFCTTFTAKGLDCEIGEGGVQIHAEGRIRKFVERVSQVSFNGQLAVQRKQRVVVVTERAVFRLTENGWLLTELAPGIDLERDVLANMDFAPMVAPELRRMDPRLYKPAPFGLRDILRNETEKE